MLWRYQVIGTRYDKRKIELVSTFSYERAMGCLALYHREFRNVYESVVVKFPWWSFLTTD
jgi:hypothetical protein